ncbi:hypothetical protein ACFWUZ_12335 [Streptomyces sp. NPDC058646]|uniref:hypothetical protein n=1 Tax=Streptomyces sp. NPDC058646 TaxID=3346574 RepID=UPI0036490163
MADDKTEAMRRAREARLKHGRPANPPQGVAAEPPEPRRPTPSPSPDPSSPAPQHPARQAPQRRPATRPARSAAVRSRTGLGPWEAVGQTGALVLVLWQLLVLTGWQVPFQKSAELSVHWRYPGELAVRQAALDDFREVRDFVLFQGPGRDHPWLFPACAVLLLLLVRAAGPPAGLQALLGWAVCVYGLAAVFASGPVLLRQWPLTALLLLLAAGFLYRIRVRE